MKRENGLNALSIVAFILSFILFPVGLILSIIGLAKCKKYKKEYGENPKYFAFNIVGLVISILGLMITLFIFGIIFFAFAILASNEKYVEGNYTCYYPYSYRPAVSAKFKNGNFTWSKYNDEKNNEVQGTYKLKSVETKNGNYAYKLTITPKKYKSDTKISVKDNYDIYIKKASGKITITFDTGTTYNCSKKGTSNEL